MKAALPTVRTPRPDEAERLTEVCRAAKAHWGYPAEWMSAWAPELTVESNYLANNPVGVIDHAGRPVGFYGLRHDGTDWWLEHLWLVPSVLGQGWGRQLFEQAAAAARASGAGKLRIKSDPNAENFYLRMGAVRVGEERYVFLGKHPRELPILEYGL